MLAKIRDRWDSDKTMRNTRVWIIYRSRMTIRVKKNRSSTQRSDMNCRM